MKSRLNKAGAARQTVGMAKLDADRLKVILEDTRARHDAMVKLIYHNDRLAMSLLTLYATLGTAGASAAVAAYKEYFALSVALATAALVSVVGAGLCFWALRSIDIALPGRAPDFWTWSLDRRVTEKHLINGYLSESEKQYQANKRANRQAANALQLAKACAALSPIIVLLSALVAVLLTR